VNNATSSRGSTANNNTGNATGVDANSIMAVFNRERSAMNANVPYEAENVGVRGHTTTVPLDQMQDIWLREKANWNGGMFPSGCASGKVCGHYTQMVY